MAQVLIEYDARSAVSREILQMLIDSKRFKIGKVKKNVFTRKKMNGLEEAIEDIKMGRVIKHKNFEAYQKAVYQELG